MGEAPKTKGFSQIQFYLCNILIKEFHSVRKIMFDIKFPYKKNVILKILNIIELILSDIKIVNPVEVMEEVRKVKKILSGRTC